MTAGRAIAPLRVLHLVQQNQRRGAEMFAWDLTTELLARGHEVLTVYLYTSEADELPARSGDLYLDGDRRHAAEKLPGVQPHLLSRLRKIVSDFQPHVVQANGARTLKYGAVLKIMSRHPFRFVYRSIGDPLVWVRGRLRRALYRNVFVPQVDAIAAVSTATKNGLEQLYRLGGVTVRTIPRGIDALRLEARRGRAMVRSSLDTPADAPVVLFIGSLTPEKRPDRLLRVMDAVGLELADAHLWVVGDGPLRGDVEARARGGKRSSRTHFVGATEHVGDYLCAADLLLLTSDTEGLPGVVLEAAAMGLPIVSTNVGGITDALEPDISGLLSPPDNEAALAAACIRVLNDRGIADRLSTAARAKFVRDFAIATVATSYEELYTGL